MAKLTSAQKKSWEATFKKNLGSVSADLQQMKMADLRKVASKYGVSGRSKFAIMQGLSKKVASDVYKEVSNAQARRSGTSIYANDGPKIPKDIGSKSQKKIISDIKSEIQRVGKGKSTSRASSKSNAIKPKSKPKPQAKKATQYVSDRSKKLARDGVRDIINRTKAMGIGAETRMFVGPEPKVGASHSTNMRYVNDIARGAGTSDLRAIASKVDGDVFHYAKDKNPIKPKASWLSRQFNSAYKSVSGAGSSAYKSIFGAPQAAKSALKYAAKNPLAVAKAGGKFGAGVGGAIAAYSVGEALGRSAGRAVGDALGGGKVGDFSEKVGSLSGGTVGTTASLGVGSSLAARRAAKKAGKKLGAKAAAKIALKVGARAIPVVGQGVMVFDAVLATGEAIQEVQQMRKQGIEYQNSWYQEKNRALRGGDLQQAFQAMSSDDKAKFQTLKNKDDRFAMLERSHSTNVASNQEQRRIARGGEPQKADKQIVGKSASDVKSKVAKVNGNRRGAVKLKAPDKPKRKAVVKAKTQTQKRKPAAKKEVARFQTMANGKMSEKKWTDRGWANRKAAAKKRRKS